MVPWLGLGALNAGAQLRSLVGELRSRKPCGTAKKKKQLKILAFIVFLVARVKNQHHTSGISHLDLTYKFKSNINSLILQNIPQPPYTTIANTVIHE